MIDAQLRRVLTAPLDRMATWLDLRWITPDRLTGLNLVLGLTSATFAAVQWWIPALIAWLLCRLADGLDGPLARRRIRRNPAAVESGRGGFLDVAADFVVYGATVIGVAVGVTTGYDAPWLPFLVVLFAYYINGSVLLAFSSIAEKQGRQLDDERSFSFLAGLAEGAETVLVHSLWLLFPMVAWQIAWVWAIVVLISATQRIIIGYRTLE